MTDRPILDVRHLSKSYRNGSDELVVLRDITFQLMPAETCAIVGPSGSGKTTLLGLCAGLDRATSGSIALDGENLGALSEDQRALLRRAHIGFVFQTFRLIPTLTALENIMVPLELLGIRDARERASFLLSQVQLSSRAQHYPEQLSGGEQQRVALARAFAHRPKLLFADEPTGNLDAETSATIIDLLFTLNQSAGTTLVMVTHDSELAAKTGRLIRLRAGALAAN